MTRNHFEPFITSSVCIAQVMGNYNCKIVPDDDHGHVFYVKLPLPEDAARFHGHSWVWWNESLTSKSRKWLKDAYVKASLWFKRTVIRGSIYRKQMLFTFCFANLNYCYVVSSCWPTPLLLKCVLHKLHINCYKEIT
uniref:Uncharacterized protein n=1 Tax=Setaria italica TaxID=4555 RepID=K3YAP1_SETIT